MGFALELVYLHMQPSRSRWAPRTARVLTKGAVVGAVTTSAWYKLIKGPGIGLLGEGSEV